MSAFEEFLSTHPVFTVEDFDEFQHKRGSFSPSTRKTILARQTARGRLVRVKKGLYAAVPHGIKPENAPIDSYLIAAKATPDSVLAYHTAAEFYGKAYSTFNEIQFLTARPRKAFSFGPNRFRPVGVPKSLSEQNAERFGVEAQVREGLTVYTTSMERTAVDLLDRLDLCGGFEEAFRYLEGLGYVDGDSIAAYLDLLGNSSTAAKVGYCLEKLQEDLSVSDQTLKQIEALRPKQPYYVDRKKGADHRFSSRWNLLLPANLADGAWTETGMEKE